MEQVTQAQVRAYIQTCKAVAEAIRELGSVPSGHLYARLMSMMSIETYSRIISALKGAGLVSESGHLLTWIGPTEAK